MFWVMKAVKKSTGGRRKADPSLSRIRSAVTNGSQVLLGCDHRSARMRRFRDLISAHIYDLGGPETCSQAELSIIRRAALLTLELETLEVRFETNGEANIKELECYQRVSSSLRRLLMSLGLSRRSKDITPDPLTYARQYDREAEEAEVVE
jgi:hypothetical protein